MPAPATSTAAAVRSAAPVPSPIVDWFAMVSSSTGRRPLRRFLPRVRWLPISGHPSSRDGSA